MEKKSLETTTRIAPFPQSLLPNFSLPEHQEQGPSSLGYQSIITNESMVPINQKSFRAGSYRTLRVKSRKKSRSVKERAVLKHAVRRERDLVITSTQ